MNDKQWYVLFGLIIAWHALFTFFLPDIAIARIPSGIALLFVIPGWFIERVLFRTPDILERTLIVMLSSAATSILWALMLNQLMRIPFGDVEIFFMSITLILLFGIMHFILREEPRNAEPDVRKRRKY